MSIAYIVIGGGLGNQMFQAAFGAALESLFGVEIRYLSGPPEADPFGRSFLLDNFPALRSKLVESAANDLPACGEQDADLARLAELARRQPRTRFEGYWQDERFFFGQNVAVAASFRVEPDTGLALRANEIVATGAIGVHVRRSEYGVHGLATVEYYRNAIADIRRETGPAPVVCFTDEPNFCRGAFRDIADVNVVQPDLARPLDDLYLLSQCRHFVIANSSFSWWAAWLGASSSSIVYAPQPWCVFDPATQPVPSRWRGVEDAVREP
jgi:hypothetical protein